MGNWRFRKNVNFQYRSTQCRRGNLGIKGAHYGWPFREGSYVFDVNANPELVYTPSSSESNEEYIDPVIQYDHDEGNAVSGGFVYNQAELPLLNDHYLFGDIPRGTLFLSPLDEIENGKKASIQKIGLELNAEPISLIDLRPNERVDLRFGQDSKGNLYLFTKAMERSIELLTLRSQSILQATNLLYLF